MAIRLLLEMKEYCAVVISSRKEDLKTTELHSKMVICEPWFFSFNFPVKKWEAECKRGRECVQDDSREERDKSEAALEIIEIVHGMILEDRLRNSVKLLVL